MVYRQKEEFVTYYQNEVYTSESRDNSSPGIKHPMKKHRISMFFGLVEVYPGRVISMFLI